MREGRRGVPLRRLSPAFSPRSSPRRALVTSSDYAFCWVTLFPGELWEDKWCVTGQKTVKKTKQKTAATRNDFMTF